MSKRWSALNPSAWPLRVKLMLLAFFVACGGVWGFAFYAQATLQNALEQEGLVRTHDEAVHQAEDMDDRLEDYVVRRQGTANILDMQRLDDVAYVREFLSERYRFQQHFAPGGSFSSTGMAGPWPITRPCRAGWGTITPIGTTSDGLSKPAGQSSVSPCGPASSSIRWS